MKDIQSVFNEQQEVKKDMKDIRKEYRDAMAQDEEYQILKEKAEKLRDEKKQMETLIQNAMGKRWLDLEDLKDKDKSLKEMASDIAMTTLMDGKTVEVRDEYDSLYEPVYTVAFKKAD